MEKKLEELLAKLASMEGSIMTKDKIEGMLAEIKKELATIESPSAIELKKQVAGLIAEVTELKAGKGEAFATSGTEDAEMKKQADMMERYFKKGDNALTPEERKLMTSNDDTTGGYLAGRQLDRAIIKDLREMNAMMAVATIKQTSYKVYTFIKVNNITKATTAAEGAKGTNKDATFSKIDISTYSYKHSIYVTEEDIEDADVNISQVIQEQLGEGLAEACEDDFFVGNGVEKARGFLTDATILAAAAETASSGTFIDEDIVTVVGKLKSKYRKNASFMANREIITHIAKMKDGTGKFVYSMESLKDYPNSYGTLMGLPLYEAPSMATTVAAGNIVLACGDFAKGYVIVERTGTVVKRDDVTASEEGVVKFLGRKRLGGMTVQPEAIAILKVKA